MDFNVYMSTACHWPEDEDWNNANEAASFCIVRWRRHLLVIVGFHVIEQLLACDDTKTSIYCLLYDELLTTEDASTSTSTLCKSQLYKCSSIRLPLRMHPTRVRAHKPTVATSAGCSVVRKR